METYEISKASFLSCISGGAGLESSISFKFSLPILVLSLTLIPSMGSFDKLDEVLLHLSNHQLSLGESMNCLTQKIDELLN